MIKRTLFRASIIASVIAVTGCSQLTGSQPQTIKTPQPEIKNVILMIGDGMGPQQVGLLEEFAHRAKNSPYQDGKTALATFAESGHVGISRHSPYGGLVVDSACSATQLAIGQASDSEMIGLDAQGNPATTVLEYAKARGMATGLVSDTRLTHATPASFAAHQAHRSMENEIAEDMVLNDTVDVMLSGGLRHFIPKNAKENVSVKNLVADDRVSLRSKRKDQKNLLVEAQKLGYQLAFTRQQLASTKGTNKLLGLFASSGMADGISHHLTKNDPARVQPNLREMTIKALDILSRDPDGFFLMVEGGQIDWAGHANDAGTLLHEMLKFDEAIAAVHDWVKDRNDTLVVITADHETGGFGFSYGRKDIPGPRSKPGSAFKDRDFYPNYNFGQIDILDKLYGQKKNFYGMWDEARQGNTFPTVKDMLETVNKNSEFKIDENEAATILAREPNNYYLKGHKYLDAKEFPKVDDFEEFYVYGNDVHKNLIGRVLGKHQNVVWATGSHTHTLVPVIAWGPEATVKQFSKLLHHTEIGKKLIEVVKK